MKRTLSVLAVLAVGVPGAHAADARHAELPPGLSKVSTIKRIYPTLWRNEQARKDGVRWERLRRAARGEWLRTHPEFRRNRRIAWLIAHANPARNREIAKLVLSPGEFACMDAIVARESSWVRTVYNRAGSGAYGIPQALPGHKMRSAGADWRTNPLTQIRWMQGYANGRYGGLCAALSFRRANGWY